MSFTSRIAQATVDLLINNKGTNAALDETKRKLRELKAEGEKGGDVFKTATQSASKFQMVVSKLLWPVAMLAGVTRLIEKIDEASAQAAQLQADFEKMAEGVSKSFAKIGRPDQGALGNSLRDIRDGIAAELDKISDETAKRVNDAEHRTLLGQGWAAIWGIPGVEEIEKASAEATAAAINAAAQAEKRIRARQAEADAAAAAETEQKENEEYHRRLGEQWKFEQAKIKQAQDAAAELAALDEAETQRYIDRIMRETEAERKAAEERVRIAEEEAERRADALEQVADAYRRIRDEQERGLTPGDVNFGSTEAATYAIALRARTERGGR